jgi:hypothetical protein
MSQLAPDPKASETLVQDLRQLISDARRHAASVVNSALTLLYWRVGDHIRREALQNERARYGQQIFATLSRELIAEFGRGFDATNLSRMMKFVESFPDEERQEGSRRRLPRPRSLYISTFGISIAFFDSAAFRFRVRRIQSDSSWLLQHTPVYLR